MLFRNHDDAGWPLEQEPLGDRPVPPIPAVLLDAPHTADLLPADRCAPCDCTHCIPDEPALDRDPTPALVLTDELAATFQRQWTRAQQHTAAAWQAAAALHARVRTTRGVAAAEHVGADLALQMNVHPRAGDTLLGTALSACQHVPALVQLVLDGALGVKHVDALLHEAGKWTDTPEQAAAVITATLERCRARLDRYGWPTPTELRQRVRAAAILLDLQVMTRAKRTVAERRGAYLSRTGIGQAALTLEGPELMLLQAYRAIHARADALGRLPGDSRTDQQRLHDAALELLCVEADGAPSAVPATGVDGHPVTITVRGVQLVVLVPYSVLHGGDLELAEIPGYGPLLPSTARELAQHAASFRRVAIDAETGHLIHIDDATPTPRPPAPDTAAQPSRAPGASPAPDRNDDPPADPENPEDPDGDGGPDHPEGPDDPEGPEDDDGADADHDLDDGPDDEPPPDAPADHRPDHCADGCADGRDTAIDLGIEAARLARAGNARALRQLLESVEPDPAPPEPEPAPTPAPELDPHTRSLLQRLVVAPISTHDLSSASYRVPGRLRRHVIQRDRTCTFPGCTVSGEHCDVDHRTHWPDGPTTEANCHCVCRRHHRAKQAYFTVTLDPDTGDTLWTTPDGRTYRRPPPTF